MKNHHTKLVIKAIKGNQSAFERLLKEHYQQIYRTAYLYVHNQEDALDIVQEATYQAYISIQNLQNPEYFMTWLTKIIIRCAGKFLLKKEKSITLNEELSINHQNVTYINKDDELILVEAINSLKEKYRTVIILFYYYDHSIKVISEIMDIPEGTVKTYLRRAKEVLRKHLERRVLVMDPNSFKDEIQTIDVPKSAVIKAIDKGIIRGKKSKKKRLLSLYIKRISGMVAACVLGSILFYSLFPNDVPKALAKIPIFHDIFYIFNDEVGEELAQVNAVAELNQSITQNGVTVNLTSAYFDGTTISITGKVSGKLKYTPNEEDELSIDANFGSYRGDHSSTRFEKTSTGFDFQWILTYPHKEIKNAFVLPINIHSVNLTKGDWKFNIQISQQKNTTFVINDEKEYRYEGIKIKINEIETARATANILFETTSQHKGDTVYIRKAYDQQGNMIMNNENPTVLNESMEVDGYHVLRRSNVKKVHSKMDSITFHPILRYAENSKPTRLFKTPIQINSKRSDIKLIINQIYQKKQQLILEYELLGLSGKTMNQYTDILESAFTIINNGFENKENYIHPYQVSKHSVSINTTKVIDANHSTFQSTFNMKEFDRYSLNTDYLIFRFSSLIPAKELEPFTVTIPTNRNEQ